MKAELGESEKLQSDSSSVSGDERKSGRWSARVVRMEIAYLERS
jgi:hypothetical protein